mmetsp:Transcript_45356/g.82853  ORF Transcript_45356/g.82853 Transcript_45356/m.82853 type:complete len:236 (+) Transcript_45356:752-1459(+)
MPVRGDPDSESGPAAGQSGGPCEPASKSARSIVSSPGSSPQSEIASNAALPIGCSSCTSRTSLASRAPLLKPFSGTSSRNPMPRQTATGANRIFRHRRNLPAGPASTADLLLVRVSMPGSDSTVIKYVDTARPVEVHASAAHKSTTSCNSGRWRATSTTSSACKPNTRSGDMYLSGGGVISFYDTPGCLHGVLLFMRGVWSAGAKIPDEWPNVPAHPIHWQPPCTASHATMNRPS